MSSCFVYMDVRIVGRSWPSNIISMVESTGSLEWIWWHGGEVLCQDRCEIAVAVNNNIDGLTMSAMRVGYTAVIRTQPYFGFK